MGELPLALLTSELTQTHKVPREWGDDEGKPRYELYAPLAESDSAVFVKHLPPEQDVGRTTYGLLAALDRAVRGRSAAERLYVTSTSVGSPTSWWTRRGRHSVAGTRSPWPAASSTATCRSPRRAVPRPADDSVSMRRSCSA
jgi:hypothetical protein